ncbi:MAG: 2Fe-2S iron-sulfur cluster-binding protein [Janthinobacterium lividum]
MRLSFVGPDGAVVAVEGLAGERLLDAAQRAGMPLEGTCNGFLACGTCHVMLPDGTPVPPPTGEEEDMLDLLPDATRRSRLSCQVMLVAALDGLIVTVPAA